jgi:hypothetical protein
MNKYIVIGLTILVSLLTVRYIVLKKRCQDRARDIPALRMNWIRDAIVTLRTRKDLPSVDLKNSGNVLPPMGVIAFSSGGDIRWTSRTFHGEEKAYCCIPFCDSWKVDYPWIGDLVVLLDGNSVTVYNTHICDSLPLNNAGVDNYDDPKKVLSLIKLGLTSR